MNTPRNIPPFYPKSKLILLSRRTIKNCQLNARHVFTSSSSIVRQTFSSSKPTIHQPVPGKLPQTMPSIFPSVKTTMGMSQNFLNKLLAGETFRCCEVYLRKIYCVKDWPCYEKMFPGEKVEMNSV